MPTAARGGGRRRAARLEVWTIFEWYDDDCNLAHRGIGSLSAFVSRRADPLADSPVDRNASAATAQNSASGLVTETSATPREWCGRRYFANRRSSLAAHRTIPDLFLWIAVTP